MKKAIIICLFLALILITAVAFVCGAVESYQYDMDPQNGVDLLEGLGAAFLLIIGAFVVFYEFDLFYTVYYLFVKQRTITRSLLNILANLSLVLIFVYTNLSNIYMELRVYEEIPLILFLVYIVLRLANAVIATVFSD